MTEKALNQLGITSYSQLAELQRHDIETKAAVAGTIEGETDLLDQKRETV